MAGDNEIYNNKIFDDKIFGDKIFGDQIYNDVEINKYMDDDDDAQWQDNPYFGAYKDALNRLTKKFAIDYGMTNNYNVDDVNDLAYVQQHDLIDELLFVTTEMSKHDAIKKGGHGANINKFTNKCKNGNATNNYAVDNNNAKNNKKKN